LRVLIIAFLKLVFFKFILQKMTVDFKCYNDTYTYKTYV
jgi:hypothetical protein